MAGETRGAAAPLHERYAVREIDAQRPWAWLAAGWHDLTAAPRVSLGWGFLFTLAGLAILAFVHFTRLYNLLLPLAAGFMLVAPVLVAGLYEVSRRLERGEAVSFGTPLAAWRQHPGQLGLMGVVLGLFFLAWLRIATLLFAGYFGSAPPSFGASLPDLRGFVENVILSGTNIEFLIISTVIGAVLAVIVFAISAVSVPMMLDREVNIVEAMATSAAAVRRNPWPLLVWAILVILFAAAGIVVVFVGLTVTLPLLAHATWHAYRDLVPAPGDAPAAESDEARGSS